MNTSETNSLKIKRQMPNRVDLKAKYINGKSLVHHTDLPFISDGLVNQIILDILSLAFFQIVLLHLVIMLLSFQSKTE